MFSNERLKELRLEKGLSQSKLANTIGVTRQSYQNWEVGKTKPNQKNLNDLANLLDVPVTYFESEFAIVNNFLQLTERNQTKAERYVEQLLQSQLDNNNVIQLYPVEVKADIALSAGKGEGLFDEYETETVYSDKEFYGYDVATYVEGDSMLPTYQSGEVALIRETGFDYDGAVYALVWEGNTYIKKLYKEETGLRMVSINSDKYAERFISYDDDFHIVGKVIGHFIPVTEA